MSDSPPSATGRFFKLAGMTARISGDVARDRWQRLWQGDSDRSASDTELYSRIGVEIANTLGGMKGAVMKVGQVVSQYRDLLPPELVNALSKLQKDSPPLPFSAIEPRLRAAFGEQLYEHFSSIEQTPIASASIAQVHRARTKSGQEVVLKVQYPGVDGAIASDLRQLKLALKIARVLPVSGDLLDALFDEIRRSLESELDYRQEAQSIDAFRAFHAHEPRIVIPAVLHELSTEHVLTLAYEPGDALNELGDRYDQAARNALGMLLFKTLGEQLYHFQRIHCDPHPGNFAARRDGSLVIYDFGCVKTLPEGVAANYRTITLAALNDQAGGLESGLIKLGARNTRHTTAMPHAFYQPWIGFTQECFSATPVNFGTYPLAERVIKLSREALPYWRAFQPVPEIVMINRTLGGHYWNLREMGCELALKPLLDDLLGVSSKP